MFRTKCLYRNITDKLIASTVRDGGAVEDAMGLLSRVGGAMEDTMHMGLLSREVGAQEIPWISFQGSRDHGRYHGSPVKGVRAVEKPWFSSKGRHGRRRCHGSPAKGGRAMEDTMGHLLRVVGT